MGVDPPSTLPRDEPGVRAPPLAPPRPHLFLLFECARPVAGSSCHLLEGVGEVVIGRGEARACKREPAPDGDGQSLVLRVPDPWMSSRHARLVHTAEGFRLEDLESRNGTLLFGQAIESTLLRDGDLLELGQTFFLYREVSPPWSGAPPDLEAAAFATGIAAVESSVARLRAELWTLRQIAPTRVSVVVRGESGTGKELIARAVHALSGRSGEFVALNCGALPETLVESELFGFHKGAFSGATRDRPGLVRSADNGTLFLDEIGDLSPAAQGALLRVLQEREVLSLGAVRPVPVDVRLVSATHRDLEAMVEGGSFRADLFARLGGLEVHLPPLRERRQDLGMLTGALLRRLLPQGSAAIRFEPEAARALFAHDWPLNVRELEKCLGLALSLAQADGAPLALRQLPPALRRAVEELERPGGTGATRLSAEDESLRRQLEATLRQHQGNISAAARAMGRQRVQLHRWIKRYGLDPRSFRPK